jgi:hypothetical protein
VRNIGLYEDEAGAALDVRLADVVGAANAEFAGFAELRGVLGCGGGEDVFEGFGG